MATLLLLVVLASLALLPGRAVAQSAGTTELAGTLFDDTLYAPTIERSMRFRVYLPPDYFTNENRRYPVLYMLHGAGGDYTEWSDSFLPQRVDGMIMSGLIQPMIVVMPDGGGRTYWANWSDGGPRWSDYVAQDVVGTIDTRFRTIPYRTSRAIGGLSMGGLGALQIAIHNPDVFSVVGAHSPSIRLDPDPDMWYLSGQSWFENDPIWLIRHREGAERISYWVDVGTDDWWRPNIEELRTTMLDTGLNLTYRVFYGTHEADYWIEHVPDYLAFYSDMLRV
jgi:enterochelin esterase-like enzyme